MQCSAIFNVSKAYKNILYTQEIIDSTRITHHCLAATICISHCIVLFIIIKL